MNIERSLNNGEYIELRRALRDKKEKLYVIKNKFLKTNGIATYEDNFDSESDFENRILIELLEEITYILSNKYMISKATKKESYIDMILEDKSNPKNIIKIYVKKEAGERAFNLVCNIERIINKAKEVENKKSLLLVIDDGVYIKKVNQSYRIVFQ